MFTYLQDATMRLLRKNDWMDNATNTAATFKLDQMALKLLDTRLGNDSEELVREYDKVR